MFICERKEGGQRRKKETDPAVEGQGVDTEREKEHEDRGRISQGHLNGFNKI